MPGYNTHYIFGINSYRNLPDCQIKKSIYLNQGVYSLGLQGPDLFFYYLPNVIMNDENLGSIMHNYRVNLFFKNMLDELNSISDYKDFSTFSAYLSGFIAHYTLDYSTHPYIYSMTGYTTNKNNLADNYYHTHFQFESDIDMELINRYAGKQPSTFVSSSAFKFTHHQVSVIAEHLSRCINKTYPYLNTLIKPLSVQAAIYSIKAEAKMLQKCKKPAKEFIMKLESHGKFHALVSPLILLDGGIVSKDCLNLAHNTWINPWDKSIYSEDSFLQLLDKARETLLDSLILLDKNTDPALKMVNYNNNYYNDFLDKIGNRSYSSGLPLN